MRVGPSQVILSSAPQLKMDSPATRRERRKINAHHSPIRRDKGGGSGNPYTHPPSKKLAFLQGDLHFVFSCRYFACIHVRPFFFVKKSCGSHQLGKKEDRRGNGHDPDLWSDSLGRPCGCAKYQSGWSL